MATVASLNAGKSMDLALSSVQPRYRGYYRAALVALGLADGTGLTSTGQRFAHQAPDQPHLAFALAFSNSKCGRAWVDYAGARSISGLRAESAAAFLTARTDLSLTTCRRRTSTLRRWLEYCRPAMSQLDLDETRPSQPKVEGPFDWPPLDRMPHNQLPSACVASSVEGDLRAADSALVISGYAGLAEIVNILAAWELPTARPLRILLGREPSSRTQAERILSDTPLTDEIQHRWLRHGLAPNKAPGVIAALEALDADSVEVRFGCRGRAVQANIYLTNQAVTVGSSGMNNSGLRTGVVGNVRFTAVEEATRYEQARAYAENLWSAGDKGKRLLARLIEQLLKPADWPEALSRACAAVLEDEWIAQYQGLGKPPDLWPHQEAGISRGLWLVENVGGALVADATGSGKTKQGAWLLRAARDNLLRTRLTRFREPLVISPTGVTDDWKDELDEAGLEAVTPYSDGVLSDDKARNYQSLSRALAVAQIVLIDEAHRYRNPKTKRTQAVRRAQADLVLLFTATPINRRAGDLVAMLELLGPENFSDETIDRLLKLIDRPTGFDSGPELTAIRGAITRFVLRRTRSEIDTLARREPSRYHMPEQGRSARYPERANNFFDIDESKADLAIGHSIYTCAKSLTGVGRLLKMPARREMGDAEYIGWVQRWMSSAKGLARYTILECMRSSRAALIEHLIGTVQAIEMCGLTSVKWLAQKAKEPTGDIIGKLEKARGEPPATTAKQRALLEAHELPAMLYDPGEHAAACEEELARLRAIYRAVESMSGGREERKCRHLTELREQTGASVIGFDNHQITLASLERSLARAGTSRVLIASGRHTQRQRAHTRSLLKRDQKDDYIVLATDTLSEAFNLQGASSVVHLDMPTVVRTAEQRVGRVDRLNSRHDRIHVYWPDDGEPFRPRKRELLWDRLEEVQNFRGGNLRHPNASEDDAADLNDLIAVRSDELEDAFDAFRPVSDLIGEDGLVTQAAYDDVRGMEGRVNACISSVSSRRPWLFAAIAASAERRLPQWVFLEDGGQVITDLGEIAELLRGLLADAVAAPIDDRYEDVTTALLGQIREQEDQLLSPRRRRALREARHVLARHKGLSWGPNEARYDLCLRLRELFRVPRPAHRRHRPRSPRSGRQLAGPDRAHARRRST